MGVGRLLRVDDMGNWPRKGVMPVNIGDHVPGTIAEEAAQRIIDLERKVDWLASQLAMVDSSCPLPENYPCKYHYLDECKTRE